MADKNPKPSSVITLGGKGSSLSAASVFAVANGLAQVRIDSSILDKLNSSSSNRKSPPVKCHIPIPKILTLEESRAFLLALLNKLLLSGSASPVLPVLISEILNTGSKALDLGEVEVSAEEVGVLEKTCASLHGICGILDHESSALSTIADVVAAISCEASRADVLLNGSKLVGKVEVDAVSEIPKIHGSLREVVRMVHLRTRVELNSGGKVDKAVGAGKAVATVVSPLAASLRYLGESSLSRANMNLNSIGSDNLRSSLVGLFEGKCPSIDGLKNAYRLISEAVFEEDYVKFLHEVNGLLGMVWEIVIWEAITAFVSLEGSESIGKIGVEVNGGDQKGNVGKKSEKKKKVLGKGTSVIVQLVKERLQSGGGDAVDASSLLGKWVEGVHSFLDLKDPEFDSLLMKVKEILESNESRRLPKLPKERQKFQPNLGMVMGLVNPVTNAALFCFVLSWKGLGIFFFNLDWSHGTRDFAKEQMAVREKAFSIIGDVFKRHGAMALDTPVFELRETLMGKYGEDSKLIYDLADQLKRATFLPFSFKRSHGENLTVACFESLSYSTIECGLISVGIVVKVDVLAAVLGCRVHHLPITYLGLPLRPIPNVKAPRQLWNQAVEHLERMRVLDKKVPTYGRWKERSLKPKVLLLELELVIDFVSSILAKDVGGGELCSLRYDLTVPFARYVAMNGLTSFKRYQIAKVYRRDNPSKGRYREFYQCDFDIAGQYESMGPDFEVIKILTELLDELNIGDYEECKWRGLPHLVGLEVWVGVCGHIKIGVEWKRFAGGGEGLNYETAEKIGTFVKERGPPLELLSKLKQEGSEFLGNNASVAALTDLEILFTALEKSKCINKVGSIAAGGRYDNLIGMFGTKQVPAVGTSLERKFLLYYPASIILFKNTAEPFHFPSRGVGRQSEPLKPRPTKHFDRAEESRIPWMILVGEREQNEGIVRLRDTTTREEILVPRSRIVEELQRRLTPSS
ncbi:Histidine--tRNA ligase, cytoplasmic [Vitis vinifera]|uniref:histidine--tRNA ligase n=1 Tax=Vitis vinifera TaxID=29760 RepID=A0A438HEN7_VITVI|nr:Histidine--tRNA ligase, cytoplasmic [Vitis vinifera]